ncbi:hypothetical protein HZA86_03885 [Candidatus Uhrbacteria bacterium]|nr:hypothetical protein [Candidatus Uhrbacteria bacterium]
MEPLHKEQAAGRWFTLSLAEQMGNIGSEVGRAARAQEDRERYWLAATRAFELLDLTISDPRWSKRLKELVRVREVFGDALLGGNMYHTTLQDLDRYFYYFALVARAKR